jgi:hypothetical protein
MYLFGMQHAPAAVPAAKMKVPVTKMRNVPSDSALTRICAILKMKEKSWLVLRAEMHNSIVHTTSNLVY